MRFAGLALNALLVPAVLSAQQKVELPARDRLLTETPALVYSLGREDGAEWEILSGVLAVAFDARDNLYVLDSNNFRVLVFAANGKYVRRIAQRGEGPGELMVPTGMTVMTDGTIVVSDGGRRAFSLFRSDGTFIKNVPFGDREGLGGRTALSGTTDFFLDGPHAHPRGGIVAQISTRPIRNPDQPGAPTGERKIPVKWIDLSGAQPAKALYELTLPSLTPKVGSTPSGRGVSITTMPPNWTPANTFGVLPSGGIAIAHEAVYRVKVVNAAGQLERIIERPLAPRKGSDKDKEAFSKRYVEVFSQEAVQVTRSNGGGGASGAVPAEAVQRLLSTATWLDVIPVLRRVTADDPQGRIWVARTPADFGAYGPVDLLRADGTYIGTIARAILPAAVSKTGRAAFIERDELGVEHVNVKRLPAAWQ